jgi:hypothetical protein
MERVFEEVKRVLAPGGVFLFAEEPLKRLLTLRLYRCPYYDTMKPWERKLYDWGLLGYFVKDVIGAHQEESFGIRQNHTMGLREWHDMITRHFAAQQYQIFVPERGWGERIAKKVAIRLDRHGSEWRAAKLLGGTLAAVCRKAGGPPQDLPPLSRFEQFLRCPDCHGGFIRLPEEELHCVSCGYESPNEGGVYNLLPASEKKELYPGDREDVIDFCLPSHTQRLGEGWYELEGVFGNKYRWISERATARLQGVDDTPQRLRIRGSAHENAFAHGKPHIQILVNGLHAGSWTLDRNGLFVLEADVPTAGEYRIEILAGPVWQNPPDDRKFTVNLSMLRLIPRS